MKKRHKAERGSFGPIRELDNRLIAYQATVVQANETSRQDFIQRYGYDPYDPLELKP